MGEVIRSSRCIRVPCSACGTKNLVELMPRAQLIACSRCAGGLNVPSMREATGNSEGAGLSELGTYVASTRTSTAAPARRGTPLWLWALHLSLPVATIAALAWIYRDRVMTLSVPVAASSTPASKLSPVHPDPKRELLPRWQPPARELPSTDVKAPLKISEELPRATPAAAPIANAAPLEEEVPTLLPGDAAAEELFPAAPAEQAADASALAETPAIQSPLGAAFDVFRAGDLDAADTAFRPIESAAADAGRALLMLERSGHSEQAAPAIEKAMKKAKPEERDLVALCAAAVYLKPNPARSAKLVWERIAAGKEPNDALYLTLGSSLQEIVTAHGSRPMDFATYRETLVRTARALHLNVGGVDHTRFGNEWLPREQADAAWAAAAVTQKKLQQCAGVVQVEKDKLKTYGWQLEHAIRIARESGLPFDTVQSVVAVRKQIVRQKVRVTEVIKLHDEAAKQAGACRQPRFDTKIAVPAVE